MGLTFWQPCGVSVSDDVADQVRALRRQAGMSREDLAAACRSCGLAGMTDHAITNIESGRRIDGRRRREVTVDELVGLAAALGVHPAELLPQLAREQSAPMEPTEALADALCAVATAVNGLADRVGDRPVR